MDLYHYKAASERTDADERALIPGFKRKPDETRPESDAFIRHLRGQRDAWDEAAEHARDLEYESLLADDQEHSDEGDQ